MLRWTSCGLIGTLLMTYGFACAQLPVRILESAAQQERTGPGQAKMHLLVVQPGDDVISIPIGAGPLAPTTLVKANAFNTPALQEIDGPSIKGDIAYIQDDVSDSVALRVAAPDYRRPRTLSMQPKISGYASPFGGSIALSRDGQRLAVVFSPSALQMYSPPRYLATGDLIIVFTGHPGGRQVIRNVLDEGCAWFPTGSAIVFTRMCAPSSLSSMGMHVADFGPDFHHWSTIPVTFVYNLETKKSLPLAVGWSPEVAPSGSVVVVHDGNFRPHIVDVATRRSTLPALPRRFGPIIGLVDNFTFVYFARDEPGISRQSTLYNSPLVGPKEMLTIVEHDIKTGHRRILLPHVDPRSLVSLGY